MKTAFDDFPEVKETEFDQFPEVKASAFDDFPEISNPQSAIRNSPPPSTSDMPIPQPNAAITPPTPPAATSTPTAAPTPPGAGVLTIGGEPAFHQLPPAKDVELPSVWEEMNTPNVTLPRMDPTGPTAEAMARATLLGNVLPERYRQMQQGALAGAVNAAAGLAEGATSPLGVGALVLGPLGKVAQRIGAAFFGAQAAHGSGAGAGELSVNWPDLTEAQRSEALVGLGVNAAMAGLLAKHAAFPKDAVSGKADSGKQKAETLPPEQSAIRNPQSEISAEVPTLGKAEPEPVQPLETPPPVREVTPEEAARSVELRPLQRGQAVEWRRLTGAPGFAKEPPAFFPEQIGMREATPSAPTPPPRTFRINTYKRGTGNTTFIEWLEDEGGITAKSASGNPGGEYDGQPHSSELGGFSRVVFSGTASKGKLGRNTPDVIAQRAYEEGLISAPDPDLVWQRIRSEVGSYRDWRKAGGISAENARAQAEQIASLADRPKTEQRFIADSQIKPPAKAKPVNVDELTEGSTVTINGEKLKVRSIDPDTNEVELSDGKRYGVQKVEAGTVLYAERVKVKEPAASAGTPFDEPAAVESEIRNPKSEMDLKLEAQTPEQVAAERTAAAQQAALEQRANAELPTGTGDLATPDMFPGTGGAELFSRGRSEGPGAAAKSDPGFLGDEVALKNAATDIEREVLGLAARTPAERKAFTETLGAAKVRLQANPAAGAQLLRDANGLVKSRAFTDEDLGVLYFYREQLKRNRNEAAEASNTATTPEAREAALQDVARITEELQLLYDSVAQSGTITARSLVFRNAIAQDRYEFDAMLALKRAVNDGKLTPEQTAEVKAQSDKLDALKQAQDKQAERLQRDELGDLINRARTENARGAPPTLEAARDLLKNAEKPPDGKVDPHLLFELARAHIRAGIKGLDDLLDKLHNDLLPHIPDVTPKDIRDALSGYGKARYPSKDLIERELSEMKAQARLVSALEDAEAGKPPLRTGFQRGKPSDVVRDLTRKVKEAMREHGITVTSPEQQLRSALDGAKTRLRNAIKDLLKEFETGQKPAVKRSIALDAEADRLKAVRDQIKATLEAIEGKDDARAVQSAISAVEKSIAEYERRIAQRDFSPQNARGVTDTPELRELRSKRDALRATYKEMKDALFPQRTPEQIAMDALKTRIANRTAELQVKLLKGDFAKRQAREYQADPDLLRLQAEMERVKERYDLGVKADLLAKKPTHARVGDWLASWNRAFKLSGVPTLFKLVYYGTVQPIVVPLGEAAGAVAARVPGLRTVAGKAASEGPVSARALAKYYVGYWRGIQEAIEMAKHPREMRSSDTKALFERAQLPHTAAEFFGWTHEVIKTPARRAGYELALQKRLEWAIRNKINPTEPLHWVTLATAAWHDSAAHILMENNRLSTAIRQGIRALEFPDRQTGQQTLTGSVASTVAKSVATIVKVPANFAKQSLRYVGGHLAGGGRLLRAYLKGIDKLTPDEADIIMRDFKQGSLGAGLFWIGFFAPQIFGGYYTGKREDDDVQAGQIKLGEFKTKLIHHPAIEAMQMGSTFRRVWDDATHKDPDALPIATAAMTTLFGVMEHAPVANEGTHISKLFDERGRARALGETLRGNFVPQLVQNVAKWSDQNPDSGSNFLTREPMKRKPETTLQEILLGIPGLRQQVPEKPPEGMLRLRL